MKKIMMLVSMLLVTGIVAQAQTSPVRLVAQVDVGCKNRVEQVTIDRFVLAREQGGWMDFRGSVSISHKCGSLSFIGADAWISMRRQDVRMASDGTLLSPAVNAHVRCDGRTGWLNAPCRNFYLQ